ncbi:MAG: hypothetical protein KJ607_11080 [Bacteroidetes bacterium]|nr:hypothetical protein [Bacteroidota bacterium]
MERINAFLDEKLGRKEQNSFWTDVAGNREMRALFYLVLIERWQNKTLTKNQKSLAVKLYKDSPEFREQYLVYEKISASSQLHEEKERLNAIG